MACESEAFVYYAPFLPKSLQKLTLKRSQSLPLKLNKKLAVNCLESLKHLKQLTTDREISLDQIKAIRKIQNLEHLSLEISESSIPAIYSLFRGLSRLETIELLIKSDSSSFSPWKPEKIDLVWRFLKDIIRRENLKTLRLNIQNCFISRDAGFFYHLLGILSENFSLDTLDLTLHLFDYEEDEQNEGAKRILSQIQSLEIKSGQFSCIYVDFNKTLPQQKSIRLSLLSSNKQQVFDVSKLLGKCPNLKILDLHDWLGRLLIPPDSQFAAKLEVLKVNISEKEGNKIRDLLCQLSNGSQQSQLHHLYLEFSHFTDDILKELIKINSGLSPNQVQEYCISTVDVYHCPPYRAHQDNYPPQPPNSDLFSLFLESLSRLVSLSKLTIVTRFEEASPIKSLENSLKSLINLKDLELGLYRKGQEVILVNIPVENLKKLQELKLQFSYSFKFKDFFGFLHRCSEIEELERVSIDCIDIDPRNQKETREMSRILERFPKCKRIDVHREDEGDLSIKFIDALDA